MAVNLLLHLSKAFHRILSLRRKVPYYMGYLLAVGWRDRPVDLRGSGKCTKNEMVFAG